jgi:hypothetical protein
VDRIVVERHSLLKAGEKELVVSAHKIQSILLTIGAHLSTDAIELASQHNIDLVFLNKYGDPYARVWQSKMGSTVAIRRRQLEIADISEGLAFVRDWVQARSDTKSGAEKSRKGVLILTPFLPFRRQAFGVTRWGAESSASSGRQIAVFRLVLCARPDTLESLMKKGVARQLP